MGALVSVGQVRVRTLRASPNVRLYSKIPCLLFMLTIHVLSHFGLLEMISLHCLLLMNAALLLSGCVIALVDSSGVLS